MFEIAAIAALALMSAPHCAAMCGPLATCATGCDRRRHAGYQLGRLGGYAIAGAVAGRLGRGLGELLPAPWVSAVATWLVALAVVAAAVSMILRPRSIPSGAPIAIRRRRSRLARLPASLLGSLTVLLPCGALWAALALAVATGSAAGGAAAMALFAVMSGAAIAGASTLLAWMRRSRWLFAAALVTGAVMLALAPASRLAAGGADHPPSCPMHEAP